MDVKHPALQAKTGIHANQRWRSRLAAKAAGLTCYDDFADLPVDRQHQIVAEYEAESRIEALQAHEREQARERSSNRRGKGRTTVRSRR